MHIRAVLFQTLPNLTLPLKINILSPKSARTPPSLNPDTCCHYKLILKVNKTRWKTPLKFHFVHLCFFILGFRVWNPYIRSTIIHFVSDPQKRTEFPSKFDWQILQRVEPRWLGGADCLLRKFPNADDWLGGSFAHSEILQHCPRRQVSSFPK